MKKHLSYLFSVFFVLDFSGSMDQIINGKHKHIILKECVGKYLEAQNSTQPIEFLIFGTQPRLKCSDFKDEHFKPIQGLTWIKSQVPGIHGKTPLAESFRKVGRKILKSADDAQKFDQVVLLTDGADTCNEDPCSELLQLDQKLIKANKKLIVDLIGFDTQNEQGLSCFKEIKNRLNRIQLNIFDASNSVDLLNSMSKISHPQILPKGEGLLKISGAPQKEKFLAFIKDNHFNRTWSGEIQVHLPVGRYTVKGQVGDLTPLVSITEKNETTLYYAEFFKNKSSKVKLDNELVLVTAVPDSNTVKMHGSLKSVDLNAKEHDLKFGSWELVMSTPYWMKDQLKTKINVPRGENLKLNLSELFKEQLMWEEVRTQSLNSVLQLENTKILVFPEQKKIPYKKGWRVQWLVK